MNNQKKLIIACALFAIAGIITFFTWYGGSIGSDSDSNTSEHIICTKCGHEFDLSLNKFREEYDAAPAPPNPDIEDRYALRPPRMIKCPKCNEIACLAAVKCEKHGIYYPLFLPEGGDGFCTKCDEEGN